MKKAPTWQTGPHREAPLKSSRKHPHKQWLIEIAGGLAVALVMIAMGGAA